MAADCHTPASGASQREEARRFLDDYDPLGDDSALEKQNSAAPNARSDSRTTPIPKAQLATLCAVRLVDPIAFTQIFPYVNEMMERLHLTEDHSKIGFYSGLVESSFAIAQVVSIYQWARVSDTIGRRPVVLLGIFGIGLATLFMGVSTTLSGVILARCLGGLFSGNIAVIHSVLGEITDSTNQSIAFPLYGLCWPLGAIIGNVYRSPLMGGLLSNPATKFPQWFDTELFRRYPYLLPCLAAAAIAFAGCTYGYFYLGETHPNLQPRKKENIPMSERRDGSFEKPSEPASVQQLLKIPVVRALCLSGAGLSFIATGFDVTFVLFCYTSLPQGGLAFNATQIGYALSISGLISILLQLLVMPIVLRRVDHARMYNFCMGLWPFCFVLLPGLNIIARWGALDEAVGVLAPTTRALVWLGIGVILSISRTAALAFSVSMILVKDSAPNPASLGVTNGIAQFAMCLSRSFSPAFASSVLAFSIGHDFVLLRYLWVLVMTTICFLGTTLSRRIAEGMRQSAIPPR
ncbi:MFS general substrate transporter [Cubamyces sp. BRFM 1775]|nr:MFS general substrate transporter [Cubamyces sp. BRFM 1775]